MSAITLSGKKTKNKARQRVISTTEDEENRQTRQMLFEEIQILQKYFIFTFYYLVPPYQGEKYKTLGFPVQI